MGFASADTDIADILQCDVTNGVVTVTIGDLATGEGLGAAMALWGNGDGFVSVPNEPDEDGCAQVLWLQEGQTRRAVAVRDRRYSEKGGALAPGDRAIVSSSAARMFLKNAIAAIALYTENQKDNDSSMIHELNGEKGSIRMVCGKAYLTMKKDEILIGVGGTCIKLTEDGAFIYGKHFGANTGGGNLGTIGSLPPPNGVNSIVAGPAGNIGVGSTRWTISL